MSSHDAIRPRRQPVVIRIPRRGGEPEPALVPKQIPHPQTHVLSHGSGVAHRPNVPMVGTTPAVGGQNVLRFPACNPLANITVSNGGGAIIRNVPVQLLFWGSAWRTDPNPSIYSVIDAVRSMVTGPYLSRLAQYGSG